MTTGKAALFTGVLLAATLAGCGGGTTQQDQEFLHLTAYSDQLSAIDVSTRVQLGHEVCASLRKRHGDAAAVDADMATGALTPSLVATLRQDATVAYCPKWR